MATASLENTECDSKASRLLLHVQTLGDNKRLLLSYWQEFANIAHRGKETDGLNLPLFHWSHL